MRQIDAAWAALFFALVLAVLCLVLALVCLQVALWLEEVPSLRSETARLLRLLAERLKPLSERHQEDLLPGEVRATTAPGDGAKVLDLSLERRGDVDRRRHGNLRGR